MIYWGEGSSLIECKYYRHVRYKPQSGSKSVAFKRMHYFPLTPRLQRLYALDATTIKMRWYHEHNMEDDVMCHPSDSETWKHFNCTYSSFVAKSQNVRLGLCIYGFQPFGQSGQ